ncbi:hypothetical protein ACO0QE_000962 [Hanseniaspora vineae]
MEGLLYSSDNELSSENCILKVIVSDSGKKLCVELPEAKRSLEFPVNSQFLLGFDMSSVIIFWMHREIQYDFFPLSEAGDFEQTYKYFSHLVPCKKVFDDEEEKEEKGQEGQEAEFTLGDIPASQKLASAKNKPISVKQEKVPAPDASPDSFQAKLKTPAEQSLAKNKATKSKQATKNDGNVDNLLSDVNKKMNALSLKTEAKFDNVQISVFDTVREKEFVQAKTGSVAFHFSEKSDTWLQLSNEKHESLANTDCNEDIEPEFDIFRLTFKFKYYLEEQIQITYIVTFSNLLQYTKFKAAYLGYQEANRTGSSPIQVSRNFGDSFFTRSDDEDDEASDSEYEEASDEADQTSKIIDSFYRPGSTTKSLTVGLNSNRSYVVHDNNISVIKEDVINDELEYISTFENVSYNDSKPFVPSKPMMYLQDQALIFQNENAPTNLYKMDLNKGVVVEEWSMGENPIVNYSPAKKFDQLNLEQTFMGISKKSVFKVDPRISSRSKIVQDSNFEYKTNPNFSSIATSQSGFVSLGSKNGSVRLFDKLGGRAKTLINGFGDTIKHVVVSNDGRWLLATCSQNLILYDLLIAEGKPNAGVTGFQKSNSDPNFYFLTVPESFEEEQEETSTKNPVEFSKAYFNTGVEVRETTIVSSYGSYVLSWKLSNVLKGHLEPVVLKKFADNKVRENNFIFGSNDKVVIALNKGVTLASRK